MATSKRSEGINYKLIEKVGIISEYQSGWKKEVNIVSWNDGAPKFDIRDWDAGHEHMSKGVTLHEEEARKLADIILGRLDGGKTISNLRPDAESKEDSSEGLGMQGDSEED